MNVKTSLLGCCLAILSLGPSQIMAEEPDYALNEQLIKAVNEEDVSAVAELLAEDADHDMEINDFRIGIHHTASLLCEALRRDQPESVLLLLKYGSDVNQGFCDVIRNASAPFAFYGTALTEAVQYKHRDIIHLLVKHGADVNAVLFYDYRRSRPSPLNFRIESVPDLAISKKRRNT